MSNFIYIIIQKYLRTYVHTYACMHTNILTDKAVHNMLIDRATDSILTERS